MKLIFILFTTFFTSFAYSSDLSGISDDQIRSVLLAALKRFHLKSTPVNSVSPLIIQTESSSNDTNFFDKLPLDGKINILDEFIDCKSLALLKTTNRHNSQIPDSFLFRRLTKFNPYYLVEDPIVNKLLLVIISKHFVKSKNLESPHIYDELMLLIMKFNIGKLNFDLIPKKIYFYLIAFINETVRGINSSVELTEMYFFIDFFTLLRQHDMSESLQYFKDNKSEFIVSFQDQDVFIDEDLDFLHLKPTKEDIRIHFSVLPSNVTFWLNRCSQVHLFPILISILELFVDEISNSQLEEIGSKYFYSRAFIDRLLIMPNSQEIVGRRLLNSCDFSNRTQLCSAYKKAFSIDLPHCYLYTRNVLNVLDMDKIPEMYGPLEPNAFEWGFQLRILFSSRSLNLSKLEELKIILRSGLISQSHINHFLHGPNCFDFPNITTTYGELI
jgi:hypothetical protein